MGVTLVSEKDGILKHDLDVPDLRNLPSFNEMFVQKKGATITKTKDFVTSPGIIHLVHENEEQIFIDEDEIRNIEKSD